MLIACFLFNNSILFHRHHYYKISRKLASTKNWLNCRKHKNVQWYVKIIYSSYHMSDNNYSSIKYCIHHVYTLYWRFFSFLKHQVAASATAYPADDIQDLLQLRWNNTLVEPRNFNERPLSQQPSGENKFSQILKYNSAFVHLNSAPLYFREMVDALMDHFAVSVRLVKLSLTFGNNLTRNRTSPIGIQCLAYN